MIRRFGPPPVPGRRYTLRPGAYALLPRGDSILVTRQSSPWPELQLPGGGIDPGESPLRALHREVAEETGWRIAAPRRFRAFRRFTYMPDYDLWAEKLCLIFVARPTRAVASPSEPGHAALWLPLSQAMEALGNSGDRQAVRSYAAALGSSRSAG